MSTRSICPMRLIDQSQGPGFKSGFGRPGSLGRPVLTLMWLTCSSRYWESPNNINPGLVWHQPHVIYMSELEYRAAPNASAKEEVLQRLKGIVDSTAQFIADFPERRIGTGTGKRSCSFLSNEHISSAFPFMGNTLSVHSVTMQTHPGRQNGRRKGLLKKEERCSQVRRGSGSTWDRHSCPTRNGELKRSF